MAAPDFSAEDARKKVSYDPVSGAFKRITARGQTSLHQQETVKGYHKIFVFGRRFFAHRLAWLLHYGEWPEEMIDHINGDRKDNRIANLRKAVASQNAANSKKYSNNTTGFKGVSERRAGEFRARVQKDGRSVSLGSFPTAEAAHRAYVAAANNIHGEYARAA